MNIYKKLAIAIFGSAILYTTGTAPAIAAEFNLSGKFAPEADLGSTGVFVQLANGSFDGTYSVDGLPTPIGSSLALSSFNLNLRDSSGNTLINYNKANAAFGAIFGQFFGAGSNDEFVFNNGTTQFQVNFLAGFNGTGQTVGDSVFAEPETTPESRIAVLSGSSRPVPEPSSLIGTLALGAIGAGYLLKRQTKKAAI